MEANPTQLTDSDGRGGGIRTPDPLLPKQMRYQATLRPDSRIVPQSAPSGVVGEPLQEPENQEDRGQKNGGQGHGNQQKKDPISPGLFPWLLQMANDQCIVATVGLPRDIESIAQQGNRSQ